jgi:hypothetical protein
MKIYPFSVQYSLIDICRSNLVPLHIAQKFKAELSQDPGFYCDFMEIASSIMRERKVKNEELVSRDPITERPIEISSQDDMLVFFIKEQIVSLNDEFEYIIKDHLKKMEDLGVAPPPAWERVRRADKKKPLDFFLMSPDTLNCASNYIFFTGDAANQKYEGKDGGKFYFEKYIRVIDKPQGEMPQNNNEITDLLVNRRPPLVDDNEETLQVAFNSDPVGTYQLISKPDLTNVVNIQDWNTFWEGQRNLFSTNRPSDFFQSLSLGVRLVYVPLYDGPAVDTSPFADPRVTMIMIPEFSRDEKAGRLLQLDASAGFASVGRRQIISLPLMEKELDLIDSSGDTFSGVTTITDDQITSLRSDLESDQEFKFLFDYVFPTDRLFADAFINVNLDVSQNYRETNSSYTAVKRGLRNLFYVLINDDPINQCKEYEDADIMASLRGLDWNSIMEDMGIDIAQLTFDFFASILMAAINILGSAIDPFGLLKLVLCPLIPTEGDFGGFGRTIKKEWDCLTLPPFPQLPSSDSPTACKPGGLSPECLNVPQYTVVKNTEGKHLLKIPEEFEGSVYTTKDALEGAKTQHQEGERDRQHAALQATGHKAEQSPLSDWALAATPPAEPDDS